MGRLTDTTAESPSFTELRPGDSRILTTREWKDGKLGDVMGQFELRRTDRPYVYDLADAYNRRGGLPDGKAWFVDNAGGLHLGDTDEGEAATSRRIARMKAKEQARFLRKYRHADAA